MVRAVAGAGRTVGTIVGARQGRPATWAVVGSGHLPTLGCFIAGVSAAAAAG